MYIKKKSGRKEKFNIGKVKRGIRKSGGGKGLANYVGDRITLDAKEVSKQVKALLRKKNPKVARAFARFKKKKKVKKKRKVKKKKKKVKRKKKKVKKRKVKKKKKKKTKRKKKAKKKKRR